MSLLGRGLLVARRQVTATMVTATKQSQVQVQLQAQRTFTDSVGWKRWVYNSSGFCQYGLFHDDCLHEYDDVKEALARLPQELLDERAFRIQRALNCSNLKTVLPKDQWTTYEEDRERGRYLTPLLEEVRRENTEKKNWGQA